METATPDQQPAAEPPHPYDKFRHARDGLMRDFLTGLGNIETELIQHDRACERKLEAAQWKNNELAKEIVRLTTELEHRPMQVNWDGIRTHLEDLGEHRVIEGAVVPDENAEEVARLQGLLADQEGTLAAAEAEKARLAGELATEKENAAKLERDNSRLEEKIEHDRREWAAQESKRQEEAESASGETAGALAAAQGEVARLQGEVSELNGKLAEANGRAEQAEAKASQAATDLEEANRRAGKALGDLATANGRADQAATDLEEANRRAAKAEEDLVAANGRAEQAEADLAAERDKPAPPPAEVDVAAVRAKADETAKDRVATIIMAIEEDNPGISLNNSLELFATAWAAPRVEEPEPGQEGDAPADLFDFTLPPPAENEDIPYLPTAPAAADQ